METKKEVTPEEAKYWKAVHIIETNKQMLNSEEGIDELRNLVGAKTITRYLKEHPPTPKAQIDNPSEEEARERMCWAFEQTVEVIQRYMDIETDKAKLIALWIMGTYLHPNFQAYPFLFINAMRGSGKTRLLNLIAHLSKGSQGQVQTGLTESVLFRSSQGETMVLDEVESIASKDKAILREYLNACYKKGGVVKRMKKAKVDGKEDYVIDCFHPYKPIAMANIWGMDEVLGDRCISLILEKSNDPAKTKLIEDFEENPIILDIKRTFERFSVVCVMSLPSRMYNRWNHYIEQHYTYTTLTTLTTQTTTQEKAETTRGLIQEELFLKIDNLGITGRNLELLFPLIIISNYLSEELLVEFLEIGKSIMDIKQEDEFTESRDVSLYEFVANLEREGMQPMKELTNHFKLWLGESSDEWINEKWVGRALKRLNLVVDKKRMASGRFVVLDKEKAKRKLEVFGK